MQRVSLLLENECNKSKHKICVIGAGGHGKVIADIALKNGYKDINFLDDNVTGTCLGFPIVGKVELVGAMDAEFVIAIGNNKTRKMVAEAHDVKWATLIHPSAQIGMGVEIGEGTVVMAGAVINPGARIGRHCIINTCSVVEHDNVLEDFVHISPNAALSGTVHVGRGTHIGVGATVRNNITIGNDTMIGAGAVVVKNISGGGVYVGIPAHSTK